MALPAPARRRAATPPLPKRAAILRAAVDVFATHGFFGAQVADVARAAGVAAGTVYLYFRGKDDLLTSIFECTMQEALVEGRRTAEQVADPAERLRRFAREHLGRLGRDRHLAVVFQVELRQSVKFMERFSNALFQEYLGLVRTAIADGQRTGAFRPELNATVAAKIFFGALDEMATNWILSRRRYSLEGDVEAVLDVFLTGVCTR